jgi:formiminotetrahydrofolate cyclodeaminase
MKKSGKKSRETTNLPGKPATRITEVFSMDFTQNTCREFVTVLASNAPVPGGGGAAALVGAIGTALGNMVGSLTVGKKKYADVEEEIRRKAIEEYLKQQAAQAEEAKQSEEENT